MKQITVPAEIENLRKVLDFFNKEFETLKYDIKSRLQLELAIEEIYVNIANYAYGSEGGEIIICFNLEKNPLKILVQFIDCGNSFNPLEYEEPDTSAKIENRKIGGLGIFLVKNNVDYIDYEYRDGKNILTISKNLED